MTNKTFTFYFLVVTWMVVFTSLTVYAQKGNTPNLTVRTNDFAVLDHESGDGTAFHWRGELWNNSGEMVQAAICFKCNRSKNVFYLESGEVVLMPSEAIYLELIFHLPFSDWNGVYSVTENVHAKKIMFKHTMPFKERISHIKNALNMRPGIEKMVDKYTNSDMSSRRAEKLLKKTNKEINEYNDVLVRATALSNGGSIKTIYNCYEQYWEKGSALNDPIILSSTYADKIDWKPAMEWRKWETRRKDSETLVSGSFPLHDENDKVLSTPIKGKYEYPELE